MLSIILEEVQEGTNGTKRLHGPRCKANTKAGKPCRALAGADGLCTAHSGRTDMRELGRKGGKGRSGIKPERVYEGLRAYYGARSRRPRSGLLSSWRWKDRTRTRESPPLVS